MTMKYDFGNLCSGLGQAQQCDGVKPVTVIPTSHIDNRIFNDNTDINKR